MKIAIIFMVFWLAVVFSGLYVFCHEVIETNSYWFAVEHEGNNVIMDWEPLFPEKHTYIFRGERLLYKAPPGIAHYEQEMPHFGVARFTAAQEKEDGTAIIKTSYLTMGRLMFDHPSMQVDGYYTYISSTPNIEDAIQYDFGLINDIPLIWYKLRPGIYWAWASSYLGDQESVLTDPIEFRWELALNEPVF